MNLRTTILRDVEGAVHVFPNGAILTLANRTNDYAYYLIDVNVDFKQDTDEVIDLMRKTAEELQADPARQSSWSRWRCSASTASATTAHHQISIKTRRRGNGTSDGSCGVGSVCAHEAGSDSADGCARCCSTKVWTGYSGSRLPTTRARGLVYWPRSRRTPEPRAWPSPALRYP